MTREVCRAVAHSLQSARAGLIVVTVGFVLSGANAAGSASLPPKTQPLASSLQVQIDSSRPRLTAEPNLTFGLLVTITNNFDRPIYIRAADVYLVLPAEIGQTDYWRADFPTEGDDRKNINWDQQVIMLKNGGSYPVAFPVKSGGSSFGDWFRWRFIAFVPGDYKFTVVGKYWMDSRMPADGYYTFVASNALPISAPESAILLGAAIGGLICYLVLLLRSMRGMHQTNADQQMEKSSLGIALGFVGSLLWAMIVTILLSRLSETQLPIRITVNDVWGAIAVGFVSNYLGIRLLDWLIPVRARTNVSNQDQGRAAGPQSRLAAGEPLAEPESARSNDRPDPHS